MPVEVSDDALLKIATAGMLAYGAHFLAAPKHAQELYFTKVGSVVCLMARPRGGGSPRLFTSWQPGQRGE